MTQDSEMQDFENIPGGIHGLPLRLWLRSSCSGISLLGWMILYIVPILSERPFPFYLVVAMI